MAHAGSKSTRSVSLRRRRVIAAAAAFAAVIAIAVIAGVGVVGAVLGAFFFCLFQ